MTITITKSVVLNVVLTWVIAAILGIYLHERDKYAAILAERHAVREVEEYIATNVPNMPAIERRGYAEIIAAAARENRIHYSIVASVAIVESHFAKQARSEKDAVGIMQVVPKWWVGVVPGVQRRSDLYSPDVNIRAGAWVLRYMMERCGYEKMFACYEGGEQAVNWKHDTGYTAKVQKVRFGGGA